MDRYRGPCARCDRPWDDHWDFAGSPRHPDACHIYAPKAPLALRVFNKALGALLGGRS